MTVSCDPNDEICRLRIIVGDAEEPYLLDDAVYQYILDNTDSFEQAVIKAIEYCLATVTKYRDERTDEVEVDWSQIYDHYRQRYDDLVRDPAQAVFVALHRFGGVSNSERKAIYQDSNINSSPIRQGTWDRGVRNGCIDSNDYYSLGDCY